MRKFVLIILVILCIFLIYKIYEDKWKIAKENRKIEVLLVYNPDDKNEDVKNGYTSVFQEEGIPFKWITPDYLLSKAPDYIVKKNPVIIFPDTICKTLFYEISAWCRSYLVRGGNIAIIFDPGVYNRKKRFLNKGVFSDLIGLNYITYNTLKEKAYTYGKLKFKNNESASFFQIPFGKLDKDYFLSGYLFGKLQYPFARVKTIKEIDENEIYAYFFKDEKEKYPAIILGKRGKGNILYVNLPLGILKVYGTDDLVLREIMRTFLFKVVKIPHIVNTPFGKGGIVINWHIDNYRDREGISNLIKNKIIRHSMKYSFNITAGDFLNEPGDQKGFDAEGKGKKYVLLMNKYGTIGSHGGWAHNWFARNLEEGNFTKEEIEEYIIKNTQTLEKIVGYKIVEYSSPKGIHPQPLLTQILEKNGFICYYYPGDTGSFPNRTFYNGKMVSEKAIAFPVMPNRKYASLTEMAIARVPPEEVEKWLISIADYSYTNRTIRLIYSHPYDLLDAPQYVSPFKNFIDHIEELKNEGKIIVESMKYFTEFLLRFLKTEYSFKIKKDGLAVSLKNSDSLYGITIAIPRSYNTPDDKNIEIEKDSNYFYITIKEKVNEKTLFFTCF